MGSTNGFTCDTSHVFPRVEQFVSVSHSSPGAQQSVIGPRLRLAIRSLWENDNPDSTSVPVSDRFGSHVEVLEQCMSDLGRGIEFRDGGSHVLEPAVAPSAPPIAKAK
jgi:hypothetical protein